MDEYSEIYAAFQKSIKTEIKHTHERLFGYLTESKGKDKTKEKKIWGCWVVFR